MAGGPFLVIGSGGQLGTAFMQLLDDAVPVTRRELDLRSASADQIGALFDRIEPSAVLNCAAYTKVDEAESDEAIATEVNGYAVGRLAAAAANIGVPFVTYSSDYVFDGEGKRPYLESDPTDPVNAYGRSKLVGERLALAANPDALVIRTSWVLSATHRNFVSAILSRAAAGQTLQVVEDQVGCPTIADDLAVATQAALRAGGTGLLHLTNRGPTTWYHLAQTAVESAGMDPGLVRPCSTDDYPTPARRPAYSVLGSEDAPRMGLAPLPHWEESIHLVVAGASAW